MLDEVQGSTAEGGAEPARSTAAPYPPDPTLERIVALAADLFDAPAACLALRRGDGVAFAASLGLAVAARAPAWGPPWAEGGALLVPGAEPDPRLPEGAAGPFRFYAGAPLPAPGGTAGALCVLDQAPRAAPEPRSLARLESLAALAADALAAGSARGRAEAEAEAKAGLLADISHELRTPLNGIVGFTELLKRDGALGTEALRAVEHIDEAGRGLLNIVGDALDLSRLEAGAVRLDPRPFRPARLVGDAAALVRPEADRKGLGLVVEVPSADPALLGDPDRLRQVLLNLLSNAVKFTERGTVRVSLARGEGAPVPLTFAVEDSGVGIARDDLPRLFQRFARADGGAGRRVGGTGLGLAISKALVDAMGGEIAVRSAPDAGARFTVSLALPAAPEPAAPAAAGDAAGGDLGGLKILLAEDVALNQKLALGILEPLGAAVDVAADGAAALAFAARGDYALVLMDMEMPVMDGPEAARRIRALGGRAGSVPIVALTANAFPEQLDRCRAAGMEDQLIKPFGADDLVAAALRWARR